MNRRLLLALPCSVLLAGCGASGGAGSATDKAADQHAQAAGVVMTRSLDPEPSKWAAYAAVGTAGDTTIEALQADGTTYDGTVVLRITVERNAGQFNSAKSVRCYRYRLAHTTDDATPQQLDCPATAALTLATPPAAPDLSTAGAKRLTAVLTTLSSAQRADQAAVRAVVTKAFGPPAIVTVGSQAQEISINVRAEEQCLLAMLAPTGAPAVRPVHGPDCRGG
jgi:hypothetical protein